MHVCDNLAAYDYAGNGMDLFVSQGPSRRQAHANWAEIEKGLFPKMWAEEANEEWCRPRGIAEVGSLYNSWT